MKKTKFTLLAAVLTLAVLLASGCGAKPSPQGESSGATGTIVSTPSEAQGTQPTVKPSDSAPSADPSAGVSAEPSPVSEPSPGETPAASPSQAPDGGKDYAALGFSLLENDGLGLLKLRLSESELVYLLGEPEEKSDAEIWGADGLSHSVWSYPSKGLDIGMAQLPDDVEAFIFSISAAAPCTLATSRGVAVGSPKDDVLSAYQDEIDPDANEDTDTWITAGSYYGGIGFAIENGAVTYIFIGASAE
jgi:hypothetical protein